MLVVADPLLIGHLNRCEVYVEKSVAYFWRIERAIRLTVAGGTSPIAVTR